MLSGRLSLAAAGGEGTEMGAAYHSTPKRGGSFVLHLFLSKFPPGIPSNNLQNQSPLRLSREALPLGSLANKGYTKRDGFGHPLKCLWVYMGVDHESTRYE